MSDKSPPHLNTLPEEILFLIGQHIQDALHVSQEDRLSNYGVFKSNHPDRDLIAHEALWDFARTCRATWAALRPLCRRRAAVGSEAEAVKLIEAQWARDVLILDIHLGIMYRGMTTHGGPLLLRSFWDESVLLRQVIDALPNLEHLHIFFDASDNSTLALLFAFLFPGQESANGLSKRLRSLACEVDGNDTKDELQPTFVATHHILRHATNLTYIVLAAGGDGQELSYPDVMATLDEIAARAAVEPLSLVLRGVVNAQEDDPSLRELILLLARCNLKEVYMDIAWPRDSTSNPRVVADLLRPLASAPNLSLLRVGGGWPDDEQQLIARDLAALIPALIGVGFGPMSRYHKWWGVWREQREEFEIRRMVDGDLARLQEAAHTRV